MEVPEEGRGREGEGEAESTRLVALEGRLGYRFLDRGLLVAAITHRSWAGEAPGAEHNERLEFLGDSVLGLLVAEWLYATFPRRPEGELSQLKSYLVSEPVLARYAETLGLGEELRLGVGEERSGGRGKDKLLADVLEGILGALFLDGGLEPCRRIALPMLEEGAARYRETKTPDPKTELQEVLQSQGAPPPRYLLTGETGPAHDRRFIVECWSEGELLGDGEGSSKKRAEKAAAAGALAALRSKLG